MVNLPPGIAISSGTSGFSPSVRPSSTAPDGTHRFQHYAMACPWSLWIADAEFEYAAQAAQEIWDEVDRLENELSRFIVSSDIYRLNAALGEGITDWVTLGSDAWECLALGQAVGALTEGAFDIGLGLELEARRRDDDLIQSIISPPSWDGPWFRYLELEEQPLRARLTDERAQIDLGALGKGFALDRIAQLLGEWNLQRALFSSGQSTVLGIGSPLEVAVDGQSGWSVDLRQPDDLPGKTYLGKVILENRALSGSAQVLHGGHIIDGRTGKTASNWSATWATAPTAALSDACSTAFMAMDFKEIEEFCVQQIHVGALLLGQDGQLQCCGLDIWSEGSKKS